MIRHSKTGILITLIRREHKMGGITSLYTAGNLAAALELNPYLRVFLPAATMMR
jgi:hypothetical protein